jgi:hypothetical protein
MRIYTARGAGAEVNGGGRGRALAAQLRSGVVVNDGGLSACRVNRAAFELHPDLLAELTPHVQYIPIGAEPGTPYLPFSDLPVVRLLILCPRGIPLSNMLDLKRLRTRQRDVDEHVSRLSGSSFIRPS